MSLVGWALAAALAADPYGLEGAEVVSEDARTIVLDLAGREVRLRQAPGPDEPDRDGYCTTNGVQVVVGDEPPTADEAAALDAMCRRLTYDAPQLVGPPPEAAPAPPPGWPTYPHMPALWAVAVVWWFAVLLALPRRLTPWAVAAGAAALRWQLGLHTAFMGVAYPYERLLHWVGERGASALYGGGLVAVLDVVGAVVGRAPRGLYAVNLALSVLAVPLVWEAARRWGVGRRAATWAAGALAVMPHAILLAPSPSQFVGVATLGAAALVGLSRDDRLGDVLAVSSIGLVAHARPYQIPFALVGLAWLAWRRRGLALAGATALLAMRGVEIAGLVADGLPTSAGKALSPGLWLRRQVAGGAPNLVLDPTIMPFWVGPSAVWGAVVTWRRRRDVAVVMGALLGAWVLPYLHFERLTDVLRFQLPAAGGWALLAGIGLAAWARGPVRTAAVGAVVAVGLWVARHPQGGPMAHQVEHAFLDAQLAALPDGSVVFYDDAHDPDGGIAHWARVVHGVQMVPVGTRTPEPGTYLYTGRAVRISGEAPPVCRTTTVATAEAPPWTGGLIALGEAPIPLVLARVERCP